MKKIILIIILTFLTCGCYDYVELNDLSIISGIAVDYIDNNYLVTYEILNDKKAGPDSSEKGVINVSAKGQTVAEAFNNAAKETPKKTYFPHLKTLIISEYIATNKFENLIDFFLRNTDIRSEFDTVIAQDISAQDLLESSAKDNPVISDLIESLLKNNQYYKNNTSTAPFEEMVTDILIYGEEAEMAVIKKTNDKLNINGIGIFKDYKLQGILTNKESITYNVLTGNATNASYTAKCNDDNLTFAIYNSSPEISFTKDKIKINVNAKATITESNCNYDFKDAKTYNKLNKEYAKIVEKDIHNFISKTLELDSDILGIRRTYYINNRKKNKNIWKTLDYDINVNLKINKKGLIFEVKHDN